MNTMLKIGTGLAAIAALGYGMARPQTSPQAMAQQSRPDASISEIAPESLADCKAQTLDDAVRATYQIVTKAEYAFKSPKGSRTITMYYTGSAVAVHKNEEDNLLFFLTCDHVCEVPKGIFAMYLAAEQVQDNISTGVLQLERGGILQSYQYYLDENISQEELAELGIGVLKNKTTGLYAGEEHVDGNVRFKMTPLQELCHTNFDTDADWAKNDDVALLKLAEGDVKPYATWEGHWAKHADLRQGDKVLAVGFPQRLPVQATEGIITSLDAPFSPEEDNFVFTNAHLNPGNSGGPVFVARTSYAVKDGTMVVQTTYELAGLGRLHYNGEGLSGFVREDKIEKLLKSEGYSYVYKQAQ
ncbi:serine protease [Candidatus Woesearchaeota archaeon]|nr:serine protease [Candidatus Woesearchaeota archaeon]